MDRAIVGGLTLDFDALHLPICQVPLGHRSTHNLIASSAMEITAGIPADFADVPDGVYSVIERLIAQDNRLFAFIAGLFLKLDITKAFDSLMILLVCAIPLSCDDQTVSCGRVEKIGLDLPVQSQVRKLQETVQHLILSPFGMGHLTPGPEDTNFADWWGLCHYFGSMIYQPLASFPYG
ncbi:hypothetical protein ACJX0J_030039, partial [Zea mays]